MYVLYLDGGSDQDSGSGKVLGLTYSTSSFAVFQPNVRASPNLVVGASAVESAVVVHELGHVLGLVDAGTPMVQPHEDAAHAGHDASDACVMYWAIDTSDVLTLIQNRGAVPTQFDARCVADLQAAGGR
jgi:hypothetical protein